MASRDAPLHDSEMINDPLADVIIRSSDSVDFRVRKVILSEVSEFFRAMFSLPQADQVQSTSLVDSAASGPSELPVVGPVAENAKTLSLFLRLCYPNANHDLYGLREISSALQVLRKYDVQRTPDSIALALMFSIEEDPILVYAIACGYNLPKIANAAARETLRAPILTGDFFSGSKELDLMTASQFNDLLQYHLSMGKYASAIVLDWDWIDDPEDVHLPTRPNDRCTCSFNDVEADTWDAEVKSWVMTYRKELATKLKTTPDWKVACEEGDVLAGALCTAGRSTCSECKWETQVENLLKYHKALAFEVEKAIDNIPLPMPQMIIA